MPHRAASDARALGYRPALDGLRAVAVLLVIGNHAALPGFSLWMGQVGVSVFFVISGYLITGLLMARRDSLVAFWQRRALRLLPALLVMLAIVTPAALFAGIRTAWTDTFYGALYIGNWPRAAGSHMGALGNLWSLAIEEQFYLAWPILLAVVRPRIRWLLLLALAVCALRLILPADAGIYATYGRADALLLGGALALTRVRFPRWTVAAGFALIAGVYVLWLDAAAVAAWGLTLASVAGVLLVGGLAEHRVFGLDRRAPRALGRISYGLYLWNYPLVVLLDPLWGTVATFVAAATSYRIVELPFLRLKDRVSTGDRFPPFGAIGDRARRLAALLPVPFSARARCWEFVDREAPHRSIPMARWSIAPNAGNLRKAGGSQQDDPARGRRLSLSQRGEDLARVEW